LPRMFVRDTEASVECYATESLCIPPVDENLFARIRPSELARSPMRNRGRQVGSMLSDMEECADAFAQHVIGRAIHQHTGIPVSELGLK
jgi:hypothetical protein